jgi:hypothetical protein
MSSTEFNFSATTKLGNLGRHRWSGLEGAETPPRSSVILSILLAASFRVSSAVIAVRVRLCKSMELGHGSTRASLACILTSHRVAEQPSVPVTLQHFPTRQRKKAWPAHPHPDHWFVSSRFVSSRHPIVFCCHCTLHTARTHARTAPQLTPLPLSSVCLHFCYQPAPPSRQTRQYSTV